MPELFVKLMHVAHFYWNLWKKQNKSENVLFWNRPGFLNLFTKFWIVKMVQFWLAAVKLFFIDNHFCSNYIWHTSPQFSLVYVQFKIGFSNSAKKKQAMITLWGMAEHRFGNVYNYQCLTKVLHLFIWILTFPLIPFPSYYFDTKSSKIFLAKVNNNKGSLPHLYKCTFVFG